MIPASDGLPMRLGSTGATLAKRLRGALGFLTFCSPAFAFRGLPGFLARAVPVLALVVRAIAGGLGPVVGEHPNTSAPLPCNMPVLAGFCNKFKVGRNFTFPLDRWK